MAVISGVKKPWKDDEDDAVEADSHREAKGRAEPEWLRKRRRFLQEAKRQTSEGDDGHPEATLTGTLTKQKPTNYSSGVRFKIERQNYPSNAIVITGGVKQLEFDPSGSVLAVLGNKQQTVKLFQVDRHHSKGAHFRLKGEMPSPEHGTHRITSFCFVNGGSDMLMVAGHKSVMKHNVDQGSTVSIASIVGPHGIGGYTGIYAPEVQGDSTQSSVFSLSCADIGGVLVCDARSNTIMHHFQMNARSVGVAYHLQSDVIITADESSNIYEWDLKTGKCLHKFKDEHCFNMTSFAISPGVSNEFSSNGFLYTGSQTGYLNRFPLCSDPGSSSGSGSSHIQEAHIKSYGNLATAVTSIATDSRGRFVAYASEHKRNAVRIVHNATGNVIGNWPTEKFNLGRVTNMSFCSQYNTLAIGNRHGKVQFFRIFT